MVSDTVRSRLNRTPRYEAVTLILNWNGLPPRPDVSAVGDRATRRRILRDYYESVKAPTLDAIERTPEVTVDRLAGSGQAIVTAPAGALIELLDRPHSPLRDESIDIDLDIPEFATTAGR